MVKGKFGPCEGNAQQQSAKGDWKNGHLSLDFAVIFWLFLAFGSIWFLPG